MKRLGKVSHLWLDDSLQIAEINVVRNNRSLYYRNLEIFKRTNTNTLGQDKNHQTAMIGGTTNATSEDVQIDSIRQIGILNVI